MAKSNTGDDTPHPAKTIGNELFSGFELTPSAQSFLTLAVYCGDDPLHTCLIGEWQDRTSQARLTERLRNLEPTTYLDGHTATQGTVLSALETVEDVLLIDNADELRSGLRFLYEPMTQQQYTVDATTTLDIDCSVIAIMTPPHGRFSKYDPIDDQVPAGHDELALFDLVITSLRYDESHPLHDSATPSELTGEQKQHLAEANTFQPELSDDLRNQVHQQLTRDDFPPTPIEYSAHTKLAQAMARTRQSDTVSEDDVRELLTMFRDMTADTRSSTGNLDADMLETGTPKSQRDRVKLVKEVIGALEEEHDGNVPFDALADTMEQNDIDEDRLEGTLDMLMRKGDIIEPRTRHYSLTTR